MNKYLPRTPQAAQIKSHLQVSGKAHFSRKYGVFYLFTGCKQREARNNGSNSQFLAILTFLQPVNGE